jgi:ACS family phthalate transporter-like MFS transporter
MSDLGQRATRRVAYRLLPFVFLIYIVNYIDRVNVSFANLRMSADLGFSDRVYGLGVGMFYISSELLTCCHEKLLRSGVSSSACRISSAS